MCLYFCFKEGKRRLGIPNISKMHLNKRLTSIISLAYIKYVFIRIIIFFLQVLLFPPFFGGGGGYPLKVCGQYFFIYINSSAMKL